MTDPYDDETSEALLTRPEVVALQRATRLGCWHETLEPRALASPMRPIRN